MASAWTSVLLFGISLVSILQITKAGTHYVIASRNGAPCPASAQSCQNLSYYTSQPQEYFTSNTILYFLQGTHEFNVNGHLVIENVENLTLQGLEEMVSGFDEHVRQTNVVVNCSNAWSDIGNSGSAIMYSRNITIQNITFTGCGHSALHSAQLQQYFLPLFNITHAQTLLGYGTTLMMDKFVLLEGPPLSTRIWWRCTVTDSGEPYAFHLVHTNLKKQLMLFADS